MSTQPEPTLCMPCFFRLEHHTCAAPTTCPCDAEHRRPIDAPTRHVGRHHPETAQEMQRKALPRSGTRRRTLYDLLRAHPMADFQSEVETGWRQSAVSGCRSKLTDDGWVVDTGVRVVNQWGNECIVWGAVE